MKKVFPNRDMQYEIMNQGIIEGTDLEVENGKYVFTEEEKKSLRKELDCVIEASVKNALSKHNVAADDLLKQQMKNMSESSIDTFMITIECGCNFMMWMKHAPSRQDHRDKLADMLKSFKQTISYLKQVYTGNIYIPLRREISHPLLPGISPDFMVSQLIAKAAVIAAYKAEQHLESIATIIENYQRPKAVKGSPGSYTTDFAISVAHAFYSSFWVKPTMYFNGPFVKIFNKLLDILGLDYKDNSRAISIAVKSVEKEFNLQ